MIRSVLWAADARLDRASDACRRSIVLQRFTVLTRILLAMGFFPTGMIKVLGRPFTTAGTDTQVGAFFDALHGSGVWWQFIGLAQVVACLLLLVPRALLLVFSKVCPKRRPPLRSNHCRYRWQFKS